MTGTPAAGGLDDTDLDSDQLLHEWLLLVHAATVVPPPPNRWRRLATLPFRAVRRFGVLSREVGPQQAAVVAAAYARRRLVERS